MGGGYLLLLLLLLLWLLLWLLLSLSCRGLPLSRLLLGLRCSVLLLGLLLLPLFFSDLHPALPLSCGLLRACKAIVQGFLRLGLPVSFRRLPLLLPRLLLPRLILPRRRLLPRCSLLSNLRSRRRRQIRLTFNRSVGTWHLTVVLVFL